MSTYNQAVSEIFFFDQGAEPRPPEEVRFESVTAEPYPDGRRVKVNLVLTPFAERPSIEVEAFNEAGEQVASLDILEVMVPTMEVTVHLRGPQPHGEHRLRAQLYYQEQPPNDTQEVTFTVENPAQ